MLPRIMIWLSAASLSLMAGVFQAAQAAENDADLLEAVIAQNDAAIKKLGSLYVAYHWDQTSYPAPVNTDLIKMPGGETRESAEAKLWVNGDCFHQFVTRKMSWKETGEEWVDHFEVLYNEEQFVQYSSQSASVFLYRSNGHNGLSTQVRLQSPAWPMRSFINYGLKAIFSSLKELRESRVQKEKFTWAIEEEKLAEERLFRITSTRASDTPWLLYNVLVDARKDFLIREWTDYSRDGVEATHIQLDFRRLPEGSWFPDAIDVRQPGNTVLNMKADEVKILNPDNREPFALDSMLFDKEQTLMVEIFDAGQYQQQKAWWIDDWVPLDVLPPERLAAFQAARKRLPRSIR